MIHANSLALYLKSFALSSQSLKSFESYLGELFKWNQRINLVSQHSLAQAEKTHFLDSLQLLQPLLTYMQSRPNNQRGQSVTPALQGAPAARPSPCFDVYDIGSGAGFPGLVLATYFQHQNLARKKPLPPVKWHLLEACQKKAAFLQHMQRSLKLKNTRVLAKRLEHLPAQSIDLAISRGVKLQDVLKHIKGPASPLCKVLFLKGPQASGEIEKLSAKLKKNWSFKIKNYTLVQQRRHIVLAHIKKKSCDI